MGVIAASLRRSYAIHGVTLEVSSSDPAVLAAIDLRLRDFGREPECDAAAQVGIEFLSGPDWNPGRVELPPEPARPVYDTPFGTLHYAPESDVIGGRLGGVSLRCEPQRGLCLIGGPALAGQELYLATHPLATIALIELLERRGLYSLHAACVAPREGRGVLIAGASGAGKSTLTLTLARAGVPILSDDIVFLRPLPDAPGVQALGFADTIGVTGYAAERFDELRERLGAEPAADGFPKRLRRIDELFGVAVLPACMPGALVFPEVAPGQRSRIAPMSPRDALLRLVPDVLLTEPAATQAHLGAIASLLEQVDCYALRSGVDVERAADLVSALV